MSTRAVISSPVIGPPNWRSDAEYALKTQIWTALISMLLIKILHMRSSFAWHLSNFMVLLRQQLFVYHDLWKWIHDPFQAPETPPTPQLKLAFA